MVKLLANLALAAALVAGGGEAGRAQAPADAALLPVGAVAPEVEGKAPAGATLKLSSQKGKFAVVYFIRRTRRWAAPRRPAPSATRSIGS